MKVNTASGSLAGKGGHHFNGCYTSVDAGTTTQVDSGSSASCSGYQQLHLHRQRQQQKVQRDQRYNHAWTVNATSTWTGCIMDRTQDYDTNDTTPSGASTLFPAAE